MTPVSISRDHPGSWQSKATARLGVISVPESQEAPRRDQRREGVTPARDTPSRLAPKRHPTRIRASLSRSGLVDERTYQTARGALDDDAGIPEHAPQNAQELAAITVTKVPFRA